MSDLISSFVCSTDHHVCLDEAMDVAKKLCESRKVKLTPIRELVLREIWHSHKPLGAYELLPSLSQAGFNSAPPTVYRALEFLRQQGLVHRIESLNAFVGCLHPETSHTGCFFICAQCHQAKEVDAKPLQDLLTQQASQFGFAVNQETLEVFGDCPNCQQSNP